MTARQLFVIVFIIFAGCSASRPVLQYEFPRTAEEYDALAREMQRYKSDAHFRQKMGNELADILDERLQNTAEKMLETSDPKIKARIFESFWRENFGLTFGEGYSRLIFAQENFDGPKDHRAKTFIILGKWKLREKRPLTLPGSAKIYNYELWHYETEGWGSTDFYFERDRFGDYVLKMIIKY